MRKLILLLSCTLVLSTGYGQDYDLGKFSRLIPNGDIPAELLSFQKEAYNEKLEHCRSEKSSEKEFKTFTEGSASALEQILSSGNVLYNDPVTVYLNEVLDILLEKEPELKSNISVYAYKSSAVNAFMMPNGMLFVNLGLIANTTCEAELAFILSHELIHYTECHNLDLFLDRVRRKWSDKQYASDYLEYHARSRQHETEADEEGLNRYYRSSPYTLKSVSNAFRILEYAHLPFDEYPLKREEVEADVYSFDDDHFIERYNPIKNYSLLIDTLSTHPNISERRITMEQLLKNEDDKGSKFVLPEERYIHVRDLARFECINQMLLSGKYVEAYYNTRILQKDQPKNSFLMSARASALYAISRIRNLGIFEKLPNAEDAEGAMHTMVHFINNMNSEEVTMLALREAWNAYQTDKGNLYAKKIAEDLMADVLEYHDLEPVDFSDFGMSDSSYTEMMEVEEGQTKYEKLEARNKVIPLEDWKTERFMLADLKQDPLFMLSFSRVIKDAQNEEVKKVAYQQPRFSEYAKAPVNFTCLDPRFYVITDVYSSSGYNYKLKENKSMRMKQALLQSGKLLNSEITFLPALNEHVSGEAYQELATHTDLRKELRNIKELKIRGWSCYDYINHNNKDGNRYLMDMVAVSTRYSAISSTLWLYSLASVVQFPLLPFGLYNTFVGEWETKMQMIVVDQKEGILSYDLNYEVYDKPGMDFVSDFIYRSLINTKSRIHYEKSK